MNIETNKGILYPKDLEIKVIHSNGKVCLPAVRYVPHAAYNLISDTLDAVFAELENSEPSYIFVLAPLHKGKINKEDNFSLFTYSDCFIEYKNLIEKDDEVCSEEYSYEILQPYINAYFPKAKSTAFFAPEDNEELKNFVSFLKEKYTNCIIFVSGNENCCHMWYKAVL